MVTDPAGQATTPAHSAWRLDPPADVDGILGLRSALVVWDMQNGIAGNSPHTEAIVPVIRELRDVAHQLGIPVIYSQHYSLPLRFEALGFVTSRWRHLGQPDLEAIPLLAPYGSPEMDFVEDLRPDPEDVVLPKIRASFFFGTPLLAVLRACAVETLVLTGVATDKGILTTARDAALHGLFPVVVSDAVGAFSEQDQMSGLRRFSGTGDVVAASVVRAAWSARPS